MNLGAHMSIAGGVHLALRRGRSIGCNAVQLFVKSNSQWRARPLEPEEIGLFREEAGSFKRSYILAHAGYLINLASPDPALLHRSRESFLVEVARCEALGIPYIVIHPGSHRGSGEEAGLSRFAESLNILFERTRGGRSIVLLETTAGQGASLGYSFEHLAGIIAGVDGSGRLGVCFDTSHTFAAGYDMRTRKAYTETFRAFDGILGLGRLMAFHLNDSLRDLGSRVDRHTHIGQGRLGLGAFRLLLNDKRFADRPMVLETPKGPGMEEDVMNLAVLRSLRKRRRRA